MLSLWLALCAFATAVLSGTFGMAGGMVLMGAYVALLPVATAMVLHGATQLLANAARALILRRHIYWRGVGFYAAGALASFLLLAELRYVPNRLAIFLSLGLLPFVAALLPARLFDFERPSAAVACGAQVAALNLMAGAAGPLLDLAFVDTRLAKYQIVASKATVQVFSHGLKLAYFAPLVSRGELGPEALMAVLMATLLGTWTGTRILERLSDRHFRLLTRWLVYGVGAAYLLKAFSI